MRISKSNDMNQNKIKKQNGTKEWTTYKEEENVLSQHSINAVNQNRWRQMVPILLY
jgi:hypothetical protein